MTRTFVVAATLLAASQAVAQQQPYPPQQPAQGQGQPAPQAQPPAPQAPQPAVPPATAGSQGESSAAQPGSPGASSQQVVVNPPPSQQPSTAAPPPSSTTVINPPAGYRQDSVFVEQQYRTNPLATVATDAAWGGAAGLIVGFGVTLVDQFDHWGRDLTVGAGIGVLAGAAVGVVHAAYDAREADRRRRVAYGDGLNRTDRDPVVTARTMGLAFRF